MSNRFQPLFRLNLSSEISSLYQGLSKVVEKDDNWEVGVWIKGRLWERNFRYCANT